MLGPVRRAALALFFLVSAMFAGAARAESLSRFDVDGVSIPDSIPLAAAVGEAVDQLADDTIDHAGPELLFVAPQPIDLVVDPVVIGFAALPRLTPVGSQLRPVATVRGPPPAR